MRNSLLFIFIFLVGCGASERNRKIDPPVGTLVRSSSEAGQAFLRDRLESKGAIRQVVDKEGMPDYFAIFLPPNMQVVLFYISTDRMFVLSRPQGASAVSILPPERISESFLRQANAEDQRRVDAFRQAAKAPVVTLSSASTALVKSNADASGAADVTHPLSPNADQAPSTREFPDWIGMKLIFKPAPPELRKFGYQALRRDPTRIESLPYDPWVGKVLTVTGIERDTYPMGVNFTADNGERLRLVIDRSRPTLDGLAPFDDISFAKQKWAGKSLWLGRRAVVRGLDEATIEILSVKPFTRVEVQDVTASTDSFRPVRFIVKASVGQVGFVDAQLTGTNVSDRLRQPFDDFFLTDDPRKSRPWPKKIWSAIENGEVLVGMTTDQATMSWGRPRDINSTTTTQGTWSQWVYEGDRYFYTDNGKVTAVQE